MLKKVYTTFVLAYPKSVLLLLLLVIAFLGYESRKLEIDASAETLALQGDKDLKYMRAISARYATSDFLVIAYTPKADLFDAETLDDLKALSGALRKLDGVKSVTSILNVPLLESPVRPIKEMLEYIPTLESSSVDRRLARKEFLNSPLYSDNLVSPDLKTTAVLIYLRDDPRYHALLERRNILAKKADAGSITPEEKVKLEQVRAEFKTYRDRVRLRDHERIVKIRAIMDDHRKHADLFLGGISMIADDMISFVRSDLESFGVIVLVLIMVVLWTVFRQLRWVLIPLLIGSMSVIATAGVLGMFGWEVTVISSNFIALQLIITMSLVIHLVVRYRELLQNNPHVSQDQLVLVSVLSMAKPSLFAIVTTIVGFGSLIISGILPVIDLGWMMSVGIAISLVLTFLLFPAILVMLKVRPIAPVTGHRFAFTRYLAGLTELHGGLIIAVSLLIVLFAVSGAAKLKVENSFIDYFKASTEIHQGMKAIDEKLGGTTPLDVIIDFPEASETLDPQLSSGDDGFDDFEAEFTQSADEAQYWFTPQKMAKIMEVHDYLDSIPEVGKVLSLATMLKIGKRLDDGKELDGFKLALLYNELPPKFRKVLLDPYLSIEDDQVRFAIRIKDSDKGLRRDALLKRIKRELSAKLGLPAEEIHLSNMMVLYNNMLQSLFKSQILTLGLVAVILAVMFLILFRSWLIAIIAMIANILPVSFVLGFMGWVGVPLDMMTITIAAISVGIAVDDTIHYLHRYRHEFHKDGDYIAAMHRSHGSIGYAMYYTSVTIMIGFSILVFSNFIPTIYFGVLTALAMFMALTADLLLLPRLIIMFRAFGRS